MHTHNNTPSEFLVGNIHLLPKGKALDIAMGEGRNSVYLAQMGFDVEGVDNSSEAINMANAMAKEKGFDDPKTKAGVIADWLKEAFVLGHGHAMALVHVIKHGAEISVKHVGSDGVHRDETSVLRLDGKKKN